MKDTKAADVARPPRIAIAHDYLTQRGGAERVVLALSRLYPDAPIYTTLYDPAGTYPEFQKLEVRTSWLNRIPVFRKHHRLAFPFLALASRSVKVEADLVIASSSGWAHGFRTRGKKIVYCYAPARWLYEPDRYLGETAGTLARVSQRLLSPLLKRWDRRAASSADVYLAISTVTQDRIARTYGRESAILPAPLTLPTNIPGNSGGTDRLPQEGYFLVVSRLLPYKNVRPIVEAFRSLPHQRLLVIGSGPEQDELIRTAGKNVKFVQGLSDAEMQVAYARAAGLIAASHEDFGLTPLEAAAHGVPSAVLRWGGFLDTVIENETGVFFDEPTPKFIVDAIERLKRRAWDPERIKARASEFGEEAFGRRLNRVVEELQTHPASIDTGRNVSYDKP
ncbi:glycosyltransferase [Nocardioides campestrisoli]|uniref:glycosyltransferase n=1 Tax=Nocardioides campestrisoli TaxID=2736757 RepID=UPI00163D4BE3|nr:glycosyltransferase [Nocardioides campestrisoli]